MEIAAPIPCTYTPGQLSAYTYIRAGQGWDYHQNPILHSFSDGRLLMCWGAYDIQECSNDEVVLYSFSEDQGETWEPPQVFMASPSAVVSHLFFAEMEDGEALLVYREGHYYGAREDRRRKAWAGGANYGRWRCRARLRKMRLGASPRNAAAVTIPRAALPAQSPTRYPAG